jgi:hypothetical protein
MASRGDGSDFTEMASGRTRDFPATILICWFIAAIVVALSLALSGAAGRSATVASSSRVVDASPTGRLAWLAV